MICRKHVHGRYHSHHQPALQRQLFMSFSVTIVVTAAVVFGVAHFTSGPPLWSQELVRARAFVANRFGEVWDDPAARARVAEGFARDLDVQLVLKNSDGEVLLTTGAPCDGPQVSIPVQTDGQRRGMVQACLGRHRHSLWFGLAPFLLAVVTLWGASGLIARRLARPLRVVAAAASEIGEGKLATRVRLHPHSYREARVLGEVINDMAARIERQLADQKALLAAVSHEIRTPLARMRLVSEIARDRGADANTFDAIDREVGEMDALVSDLLASARLEFSVTSPTRMQAEDVAREALVRAGIDPSKLTVESPGVSFSGDPTLIARALANLIDNAQRHGGGLTALWVGERDRHVTFEAQDAGPGLEPGEEQKVFEPFYRSAKNQSQAEPRSIGLGLALVRRIAEAHGGTAYARNRPEGGAVVGLRL